MIGLKRNKKTFYLCRKIENSTKFAKPERKSLNYQPMQSEEDISVYGQDYAMYLKITCTPSQAKSFKNGDKCYIYISPPDIYDPLCTNADYKVDGDPRVTINEAQIVLVKLSGNK